MSDSEEEDAPYIPFKDRPEWKDIEPLPQDDGTNPVCRIAYTPQFIETMDYFRAIMKRDEKSERALSLTAEVLSLNAANYTVWHYRRLILMELKSDLKKELEFTSDLGSSNHKNYQIWYHRKFLIGQLKEPLNEFEYTASQIEEDNKNYHAWAHRQWVIETFNLWDNELEYIHSLLLVDARNNSAWNQRYFIVTKKATIPISQERLSTEVNYALSFIQKAPNNQSPWVYLKGLFKGKNYSIFPSLKNTMLEYREKYPACPHVISLLLDIYEQSNTTEDLKLAVKMADELANSYDVLHKKYWNYRKNKIETKLQ